jgi:hypothetical protein
MLVWRSCFAHRGLGELRDPVSGEDVVEFRGGHYLDGALTEPLTYRTRASRGRRRMVERLLRDVPDTVLEFRTGSWRRSRWAPQQPMGADSRRRRAAARSPPALASRLRGGLMLYKLLAILVSPLTRCVRVHVEGLRVEGLLFYDDRLAAHVDAGKLLPAGAQERATRACAVHACELLAARPGLLARVLDVWLWERGQRRRCKERPRHRTRTMYC